MKFNPNDFANIPRDSVRENSLCKKLRLLPAHEASEFILRLIELDPRLGLSIAKRVLREPASIKCVFEMGIQIADASTMKWWLDTCVPKLGLKKITRILEDHLKKHPDAVDHALYWIPRIRGLSHTEVSEMRRLKALLHSRDDNADE